MMSSFYWQCRVRTRAIYPLGFLNVDFGTSRKPGGKIGQPFAILFLSKRFRKLAHGADKFIGLILHDEMAAVADDDKP